MKMTEHEVVDAIGPLTHRRLRLWIRHGWVAPAAGADGLRFDDVDIARVRLVCQLKDELRLSEDAVAMVLSLMDQVYGLRRELRTLAAAVERQPKNVRRAIVSAVENATKD